MMKLQFNWTGCVTQLLWYDEVFPFFPYEHLQLPEGCGALQWAQGSVCILTSSVSLRARLETPALLSSHLGSRFEPEATDAAVRVEWNRQRAWLPRGPDACDHPLYPAAPRCFRYHWIYRTVRLKDRSMSRLSLGGDRRGGPVKCNFLYSYLNRTSEIWSRQRRQAWKYYVFSSAQVNRSRSLFRDLLDGVHSVIKRPEYFSQTFNNFVTSYKKQFNDIDQACKLIVQIYFLFVALQNLLLKL